VNGVKAGLQATLTRLGRILRRVPILSTIPDPAFPIFQKFDDLERYREHLAASDGHCRNVEGSLTPDASFFAISGICNVCWGMASTFYVDRDGENIPMWRETLTCRRCRLSNRKRAIVEYMATLPMGSDAEVFVAESAARFVGAFRKRFRNVTVGEYVSSDTARGLVSSRGVRHEDLTSLSFSDNSLDAICASEVLEHIFNYRDALSEAFRALRPDGVLVLTVPFLRGQFATSVRAIAIPGAPIVHLEPPEYHEDPSSDNGILCFYHFGWDLLAALREHGFTGVGVVECWAPHEGHLGDCLLITGSKPAI
jgi:SAM-dependent methyltransferase